MRGIALTVLWPLRRKPLPLLRRVLTAPRLALPRLEAGDKRPYRDKALTTQGPAALTAGRYCP